jgi:cell division protein FtsX
MLALVLISFGCIPAVAASADFPAADTDGLKATVAYLAGFNDRSPGTEGNRQAATYLRQRLQEIGIDTVASQSFSLPIRRHGASTLILPDRQTPAALYPLTLNAISVGGTDADGLSGPLVYVGDGRLEDFNHKPIAGAIVLMEFDSGRNWLHAANLGARALIYVDRDGANNLLFKDKFEQSPIRFPRFWLPLSKARELFGAFDQSKHTVMATDARIVTSGRWEEVEAENIYGLIPGTNPALEEEMMLVEAFYDHTALIPGNAPGADQALGIATLLELAAYLKAHPPQRTVMLLATAGHGQALAGMREFFWSIGARSKELRKLKKSLKAKAAEVKDFTRILKTATRTPLAELLNDSQSDAAVLLKKALDDRIKTEVDLISQQLMRLRMQTGAVDNQEQINRLAYKRLAIRRLSWREDFADLTNEEMALVAQLIDPARNEYERIAVAIAKRLKQLDEARRVRSLVDSTPLVAAVSLHLSSHGDGVGAFNRGWMYPLREGVNRVPFYSTLDDVLNQGIAELKNDPSLQDLFFDTLRPSRLRPWQSYLIDQPKLGGEVSALAGYLGFSLATGHDARTVWGTPADRIEDVNWAFAHRQSRLLCSLIGYLSRAERLDHDAFPRNGFATVTGRAKILRQGELFADQPAPGAVVLAFHGPVRYHAMVDATGTFRLKGIADRKHVSQKLIIEGYRFDPTTGKTELAIDKEQTGKSAYRLKIRRRLMETDLVMFSCRETTIFSLLEPRNFNYMTKIQLIDGRREAPPLRYWYSRIDTRASTISSIYLEPGTRLKLTLSDTILKKKLILTNGTAKRPQGKGYLIDEWPLLSMTQFRTASDMWALLQPRINNLESHGIYNERLRQLQNQGMAALANARQALADQAYDRFFEACSRSWALASRVYDQVETTQKDVLFGVLFYIALFVPFAFCMERLLFSYRNIHKRIIAFCALLIALIAVIYQVHPAFELAYSPTVVILAFFIMGLSLIVTLIIFFRFEEEMVLLQQRASHTQGEEIGRWKAFVAAFFLGVSNLRRRRLRTFLTCLTLIILTFTIMSFTSVKSMRRHGRLLYDRNVSYQGFLFKNVNWQNLPPDALGAIRNAFGDKPLVAPRVWLETEDRTSAARVPVRLGGATYDVRGLVGLSAVEPAVSGFDRILVGGRWFEPQERQAVIIPQRVAADLGIDPLHPEGQQITLWGMAFDVVGTFADDVYQNQVDLDGEPLTPAIFPSEASLQMTEVEIEALESGDDVRAFQSRYQHINSDQVLIIPYQTLLSLGGLLKAVAVAQTDPAQMGRIAQDLVDRFAMSMFTGEPDGTYLYHASDSMSYSGVPNIMIPLVIAVFIVLNTMIGSVYERKREIGIYTSVGLAPSHVSFLFIAEAMAFAVISVVLGYLVAQISASLFAQTALWAGITVNYSSMAGVAAMVLVILVVLISVIYPSRVAAAIAIPDVRRSFSMPTVKGKVIEVDLPFLIKIGEHTSAGGFIYSYFEAHQEVTHGGFSSGKINVMMEPSPDPAPVLPAATGKTTPCSIQLSAQIWLAPFDFGIMQTVDLDFYHSAEEKGFLEIKARIKREAGELNAWRRINKDFIMQLRKQLLLWRSLDAESKRYYAGQLKQAQQG